MLKFGIRGQAKMDGLAPVDSDCEVWLESLEDGSMVFSLRVDGRWLQSLLSMGAYDLYEKALGRSSVADDHSYFVDGAWAERALDAVYGEGLL